MVKNYLSISVACVFLLAGCGGGGSSSNDQAGDPTDMTSGEDANPGNINVLTGVFVDSPVEGVTYATATQSGTTNAAGEFSYIDGEQVVFSIGAMQLPAVQASEMITPLDIASTSSNVNQTALNIARLLQSLDQDGNPDNGIFIPDTAAAGASEINFDVSSDAFESDVNVVNLVSSTGSTNTVLISTDAANSHLKDSLGISLTEDSGATFVGFWDTSGGDSDGGRQFYHFVNVDGTATAYEEDANGGNCFIATSERFDYLGNNQYQRIFLDEDRESDLATIVVEGDVATVVGEDQSMAVFMRAI